MCAALTAAIVSGLATPAAAQGFGWFGGIFGGGSPPQRQQRTYPAYPGYGGAQRPAPSYGWGYSDGSSAADDYYRRPRPPRRRAPTTPKETAEAPTPPKTDATTFVGVFGDSLGQMLANGLDDALADRQEVGVLHLAKGSTGLVATSFYDWPKTIDNLLAAAPPRKDDAKAAKTAEGKADKPKAETDKKASTDKKATDKTNVENEPGQRIDVAVMMIGTNDRQPIVENGKTLDFESDEWTAAYRKRVVAVDDAFAKRGIPLIWVGVPITRDSGFANDMAALNDIYREAAAKTGAVFVDTWEAFSDENGDFSTYGPDINGQTVRLRSADGIHFTRAGARKLAHFVETHVRRALDGKVPPVELPTAAAPGAGTAPGAPPNAPTIAAVKPVAGPITNLNEPAKAASGELAVVEPAKPEGDTIVETALVRGEAQTAPKGRADDFRWPKTPTGSKPAAPPSAPSH